MILKIMYLKPFKNFTYLVVFQNRASSPLWRKQTKRWRPLKAAFVTWTFRLPPVFFWTFSFHLQILHVFLKFKTSVLWNNCFAKLFKETSFSKATMVMRFPAKKNAGCPKAPRDFPPRKKCILHPRRVVLRLLSPSPRVCTGVRWRHNQTFSDG